MSPPAWCRHLPLQTASIECGGQTHRITWRQGKLILEDHDLVAERALLALGGQPGQCLKVLKSWRDMHSWRIPAEVFRQMRTGPGGPNRLAPPELAALTELTLALTWQRAWKRAYHMSPHGQLVEDEVRRRARQPLVDHIGIWRKRTGARMVSAVQVQLARPGRPVALEGSMDQVAVSATATLDAGWLAGVLARGLAVVDDGFVLEVVGGRPGPEVVDVRAARWEQAADGRWAPASRPATAEREAGGGWRLRWTEGPT